MKKTYLILLTLIVLLSTFSCKKYVSQDDINPNLPITATMQTLLPTIEVDIFAEYTGQNARNAGCWVQHFTGTQFQMFDHSNYKMTENDVDNDWNTLYASGIVNCKDLIAKATTQGAPYYKGIGEVCYAMLIGLSTDFWGDVPDVEAGQGLANLNPHYDAQATVIAHIQTLLSSAIADLSASAASNTVFPGGDDLIHGGDNTAWIKTAWILKARYHNRLSKRDASGSATNALNDIDQAVAAGLSGNADDANTLFDGSANLNTWYDFDNTRADYIHAGSTLVDYMNLRNDPRAPFYFTVDTGGIYRGTPTGGTDITTSNIGSYFGSIASPLPLVTYVEGRFIEAEAALRSGNAARAQTAFTDALTNSFGQFTGIDAVGVAAYLAANGTLSLVSDSALMQIMTEKWIAMYTQPEAFADWRRSVSSTHPNGIPALTPSSIGVQPTIPVRYPTDENERFYNTNAIVISNLTTHVWWDN